MIDDEDDNFWNDPALLAYCQPAPPPSTSPPTTITTSTAHEVTSKPSSYSFLASLNPQQPSPKVARLHQTSFSQSSISTSLGPPPTPFSVSQWSTISSLSSSQPKSQTVLSQSAQSFPLSTQSSIPSSLPPLSYPTQPSNYHSGDKRPRPEQNNNFNSFPPNNNYFLPPSVGRPPLIDHDFDFDIDVSELFPLNPPPNSNIIRANPNVENHNPTHVRATINNQSSPASFSNGLIQPPRPLAYQAFPYDVNLELVNPDMFCVTCKPYSRQLLQTLDEKHPSGVVWKNVPSIRAIGMDEYPEVLKTLESMKSSGFNMEFHPIPNPVIKFLRKASVQVKVASKKRAEGIKSNKPDSEFVSSPKTTIVSNIFERLSPVLQEKLLPFQRTGIEFVFDHEGRAFIADEMGLGKTVQAIACLELYSSEWPALIVCPSTLRLNWEAEILRWLDVSNPNVIVIRTSKDISLVKRLPGRDRRSHICIISYDLVSRLVDELKELNYNVIVLDESHMIKSSEAKRTKAVLSLVDEASRVLLLSGTPALNSPVDLYTQIHALSPKLFPSFRPFTLRYCDGKQGLFGWEAKGGTNLTELNVLLRKFIMIRRKKSEVLKELPEKRRQAIVLDLPLGVIKSIQKELIKIGDCDDVLNDMISHGVDGKKTGVSKQSLIHLYSQTGIAKAKYVAEYCCELCEDLTVKLLVFGHHQDVLDQLCLYFTSHSISFIRIDGSVPLQTRQSSVERFQNDPTVRVAVLSITAASTGLTLTAASVVVMAELWWTPTLLIQAEARAHRFGQKQSVNVHYMLARQTLDDRIWPMISRKLEWIGEAIDGVEGSHLEIESIGNQGCKEKDQKSIKKFFGSSSSSPKRSLSSTSNSSNGKRNVIIL